MSSFFYLFLLPPHPGVPSVEISDSQVETAEHTAAAGQEMPRKQTGSSICSPAKTQQSRGDVQRDVSEVQSHTGDMTGG